jgi:ATP-dependent protease ClpP protease subunit
MPVACHYPSRATVRVMSSTARPLNIRARADGTAELTIFGPIGESFLGKSITPQSIDEQLKALGSPREILVRISSEGGSVFDALAIRTALVASPAKVRVRVEGLAASAATLVMLAADPGELEIAAGAMLMIHSPWQLAAGNADALREAAGVLDQVEAEMTKLYAARTGLSETRLAAMLAAETWLSADEAVDLGFADRVFDPEQLQQLAASAGALLSKYRHVPPEVMAMTTPQAGAQSAEQILAAETGRRAAIRALFRPHVDAHRDLLDECLDDPKCSAASASEKLLAKLGEDVTPTAGLMVFGGSPSRSTDFVAAATDALVMRAGIRVEKPHAAARDLASMSVLDVARSCLSMAGKTHRGLDSMRLIKAAMTTSDFPSLLENALGKALRAGYESDPQSHVAWVKKTQVPDFKSQSRLLLGSAPALEVVIEGGEYKFGGLSENKASFAVVKYGKALRLTWETLINDDLASFARIPTAMGAAARRAEADAVYTVFSANSGGGQTMQDSVNLFHASHGNLSTTVGTITATTLGAARALLRKQTALGGGYLNLAPAFLIVPAELETAAEQVMAAATRHVTDTVATNGRRTEAPTTEWISRLQLVVEPRLDEANGFYLAASSGQIDTVELATLDADGGAPVLDEENEFLVDARNYKVRHVFVAKAVDWKGLVRVPKT